jgi:alkylation response protein AidB-like acyl-CoA dehydrogenase
MEFALSEELEMIRDSAREYAERVLKPQASAADAAEQFSLEAMNGAAEAGFMGLTVSEEFGGAGLGNLHCAVMLEEINRWDPSIGVTLSVHISLVCNSIAKWGTEATQKKYLPKLASGQMIGAYCLTESQAGSDAASVRTKAEKVEGGWKINGTKSWITTGAYAGIYVVYAVTDPEGPRGRNMGAFLIERESEGVVVGKKELKLGLRASSTTEMIFEDVFVPDENLLGEAGNGFRIALDTLDGGRIGIASQSLGIHRACLEESIQYSKDRQQFGRPIGDFQAVSWKLADMATALEANRMLVHKAAWLRDKNQPCTKECSMAKLAASTACNAAAQDAVQIHGGAGYTKEFPVERHYRDARITEIYEGATDIQRLVISRHL